MGKYGLINMTTKTQSIEMQLTNSYATYSTIVTTIVSWKLLIRYMARPIGAGISRNISE